MKLKPEQIEAHLAGELAPVYLVGGDEPLQVQEAADAVRARARALGYLDREVMTVEPGFDWGVLRAAAGNLSLFAQRRLIELRLPAGKPGAPGEKALAAYAESPAPDTLLLLITGKLDAAARASAWLRAVDRAGVVVLAWPLDGRALPVWIERRMRSAGLQPARAAVALLAERVEGNLLAAAQEIDKLALLQGGKGALDAEAVAAAVADSARFDVYGLADSALEGNAARGVRMLAGLRAEGVEPVLVAWALAREVRALAAMAHAVSHGASVDQALAQQRVWDSRKAVVRRALQRHGVGVWRALLRRCAHLDRVVKGIAPGRAWDELLQLSLAIAGVNIGLAMPAATRGVPR
ncbi:MAG: DNA polymerase III subunit delta [Gammaproteobacteria bacterium]|nr:DNA polymerase III subunit delta [Gammaproteobacteria bacterium]